MSLVKVKLLTYSWSVDKDIIFWEVEKPDGKAELLLWRVENFGPTFKIPFVNIPVSLITDFSEKMIGKEFTVDIGGAGPIDPENIL